MKHYLSLGAGVQSSALALLAAHGVVTPMPIAAVFADTQDEPASVYRWLDWLERQLPYPVHRVTAGKLSDKALLAKRTKDGRVFATTAVPVFTLSSNGEVGMIPHRTCTRDFKLRPLFKAYRRLAKVPRGTKEPVVTSWIGISLDEVQRMRTSRDAWLANRYPLIELRWTRQKCLDWLEGEGYPTPPRSACTFCPFHSDKEWRRLQVDEPDEFAKAVQFERDLQVLKASTGNFTTVPYLTRRCVPLDKIDFRSDVDKGQILLWQDECEGMCGV